MHDGAEGMHEVVIAGAGPTGLMLAAELALANIDVAVVERRVDGALESARAGGLHARTLELLDQRGVVERFLAQGQKLQVTSFAQHGDLDLSDFPTRHPYGLALWQKFSERILASWVDELPVRFHRGVEVRGFTQESDRVEVALSDGRSLHARYLVACDGGRSVIRKQAGIEFPGWEASVSYLIAEARVTEPPPQGIQRDARGVYAIGKLDETHLRLVLREDEVHSGDTPSLDELRLTLRGLYGSDFGVHDVRWLSRFSDATRQAAAYRAGRVLLAGDAAHIHSPNGGQGLNLGLHDAVNLGWKLAQAVREPTSEPLLDSYQRERHPVAARILRATMAISALQRGDVRTDALRDSVSELLQSDEPRRRFAAMMSGLDVRYDVGNGHALLGRRVPDLALHTAEGPCRLFELLHEARPLWLELGAPTDFDLTPWPRVKRITARHEGVIELPVIGVVPTPSALLIRPDGHVVWTGDGSEVGLREALTSWFGAPR